MNFKLDGGPFFETSVRFVVVVAILDERLLFFELSKGVEVGIVKQMIF